MTELPANIAREAKGIHQSLKELLKTKEPFDREVDFQRKNLRRRYLILLLVHPYAKESQDVETHLWMQTSHAFIASYKQRIQALDRGIQNQNKVRQQGQRPQQDQRQNVSHVVEHRKLIQRFRQFLAEEEKFWIQLVVRLRRLFALNEATPALITLGILPEKEEAVNQRNAAEAADTVTNSGARNHFQFPPEDTSTSLVPTTDADRESKLAILTKAVVCLGDIARYREQYNESGGRPKAGQDDHVPSKRVRTRRGGQSLADLVPRPRDYHKAKQCYEQARLLMPQDGNPSHQLAILAFYQKDSFMSLFHYYRALCVRQPYDTASENLGSVLTRALDQWYDRVRPHRGNLREELPPRVRVDLFKARIVVLHAVWRTDLKEPRAMDRIRRNQRAAYDEFLGLVSDLCLPIDVIYQAIVLAQGALWKHRMFCYSPNAKQNPDTSAPREQMAIIEWRILGHLFDLHQALLEVGIHELKVLPPVDAPKDDLAQRITAIFRRTLPALRIASKWLKANIKYLTRDPEFIANLAMKKIEAASGSSGSRNNTRRFWKKLAEFLTALSRTFPAEKLPSLTEPLEEDIEMRGFVPLKDMMGEIKGDTSLASPGQAQDVHPNAWQLMRISDLLQDAGELADCKDVPIYKSDRIYVFTENSTSHVHLPDRQESAAEIRQQKVWAAIQDTRVGVDREDDNMTEITSHTDDDVLRDAFGGTLESSAEEDDEIVWDPRAPTSPAAPSMPSPASLVAPMASVQFSKSPSLPSTRSPTHSKVMSSPNAPKAQPSVPPTTAQDLFNDVVSGRAIGGALSHLESFAPAPALLFGSELSHLPGQGQNIWSASREEQSLKFTSQPNQTYQARQFTNSAASDMSQSIWSSSFSNGTENLQPNSRGFPSSPITYQPQANMSATHHRVTSASMTASPHFSSPHHGHHDPFSYSSVPQHHMQDVHGPVSNSYMNPPLTHSNGSSMYYENTPLSGYHSRHLSLHDPRLTQPPSMWSNAG